MMIQLWRKRNQSEEGKECRGIGDFFSEVIEGLSYKVTFEKILQEVREQAMQISG